MAGSSASSPQPTLLSLIRQAWAGSRAYRVALILSAIYAVLRLLIHFYTAYEIYVPSDLLVYLEAGNNFAQHLPLYPPLPLETTMPYQYPPLFAALMVPFARLPEWLTILIQSLLHVVAYVWMYVAWFRIFGGLGLREAQMKLIGLLPAWLILAEFWDDLGFLNVFVPVALFTTLLIEALVFEKLWSAVWWMSVILQIKPHWVFPVILPLLMGRYRFFATLMAIGVGVYAAAIGLTALLSTPRYAWDQYQYYWVLLTQANTLPPRIAGQDVMLGYNHSVRATLVYFFGAGSSVIIAANVLKYLLLIPLVVVLIRQILRRTLLGAHLQLSLIFAVYTGLFIWLDLVWELTFAIVVFTYLMAYIRHRVLRIVLWVLFIPYVFADFWRLLSYILFGDAVILNEEYVLTDPFGYVPLVMVINLVLHFTLLWWITTYAPRADADLQADLAGS